MSLNKGLQPGTFSILPKDPHPTFGNTQASSEGDVSALHPPLPTYRQLEQHIGLPPPPPLGHSYQPPNYHPPPSEQVYHLHFPQQPQPSLGVTHVPPQYPYSSIRNINATFPTPPPIFTGYDSRPSSTLPGHRYDFGYRVAPSALPIRDSQRTLVDFPRSTSFHGEASSTSLNSATDDPGGRKFDKPEETSNRSFEHFGKSLSIFFGLSLTFCISIQKPDLQPAITDTFSQGKNTFLSTLPVRNL